MRQGTMAVLRERARWSVYGFLGGLLLGIIVGWAFHRIVGAILSLGFVLLLLIPLVVVLIAWWRLSRRDRRDEVVVTRTVVVDRDTPLEDRDRR